MFGTIVTIFHLQEKKNQGGEWAAQSRFTMKKYTQCKNLRVSSCFGQRAYFFGPPIMIFPLRFSSRCDWHKRFLHEPLRCGWQAFPAHPSGLD